MLFDPIPKLGRVEQFHKEIDPISGRERQLKFL